MVIKELVSSGSRADEQRSLISNTLNPEHIFKHAMFRHDHTCSHMRCFNIKILTSGYDTSSTQVKLTPASRGIIPRRRLLSKSLMPSGKDQRTPLSNCKGLTRPWRMLLHAKHLSTQTGTCARTSPQTRQLVMRQLKNGAIITITCINNLKIADTQDKTTDLYFHLTPTVRGNVTTSYPRRRKMRRNKKDRKHTIADRI